ncbi:tumor necrosis factor ligand superfamily member 10-like isoform X2 [Kryptolebias marmoratus]|uniref:tumor necrosis factor ligand superfamily member 10-like isoform X2 n=1 Tax=Kryptolebias marmoratus TaxID=37003 RepID=UPI0007F885D2|nr:tumor necrosis factor ligand superfamily member 10-like isoform X2 [Kryptolebias marmoratus]
MAISLSVQCLGLIILAAVLLQTVAVALSFMYFNKVLNTMQENFSRSSVSCLINAKLHLASKDSPAEDKKGVPCWQVTQQLYYHIEKIADRFQREISTTMRNKLTGVLPVLGPGVRGVPLPKVAAHLTGVASSTRDPTAESSLSSKRYFGEHIRAWEGQRGLSFLQNMELRGGELLVPKAGLYYIYAQTYFRLPSVTETEGDAAEDEEAELIQYIYKKMSSYTGPILLMKSSRSVCWPRGQEPDLFSLHQAGTAFLQPADRLFVTVSNASSMEMDGRASYFGAFLVG